MNERASNLTDILKIRNSLVEQFESWLNNFGAYPNVGKIFMTLLLDNNPLTQEELAESLKVSQSTISRNMKFLTENYPLVSKSFVPENSKTKKTRKRKWQYEMASDSPSNLILGLFTSLVDKFKFSQMMINTKIEQVEKLDETKYSKEEIHYIKQIKIFLQNFQIINEFIIDEFSRITKNFQESVGDRLKPI